VIEHNEARYKRNAEKCGRAERKTKALIPSITEAMVAIRIQFLFSKPFTSLPLRSFFPSTSIMDRHTG